MSMKENEIDRILADLVAGERISAEDRQILENWKKASGRNSRFEREIREIASSGAKLQHRRKNAIVFEQVEQIVRKQRGRVRLVRQALLCFWVWRLILCLRENGKWGLRHG